MAPRRLPSGTVSAGPSAHPRLKAWVTGSRSTKGHPPRHGGGRQDTWLRISLSLSLTSRPTLDLAWKGSTDVFGQPPRPRGLPGAGASGRPFPLGAGLPRHEDPLPQQHGPVPLPEFRVARPDRPAGRGPSPRPSACRAIRAKGPFGSNLSLGASCFKHTMRGWRKMRAG